METIIDPVIGIKGRIAVPGDKSISHRALMLTAIAEGESRIARLSEGADVQNTLYCMQQLGVKIHQHADEVRVIGRGLSALRPSPLPLDAGNSGTTLRLLAGILATQPFTTTIHGDASLSRRPMRRIITPLQHMGAKVEAAPVGTAPLTIQGGELRGIRYQLPVASAQEKSCLLFAGLAATGETVIIEPLPTRDHSERMLAAMGAHLRRERGEIAIRQSRLYGMDLTIPGDFSSAAYFLAAAALLPGSDVILENVNLNPTRAALLEVMRAMGVRIDIEEQDTGGFEPVATLRVRPATLRAVAIGKNLVPLLIDEIPILAVLATQAKGETRIAGAAELRVKESDRIAALAKNLSAMRAEVEELPDGLVIRGPTPLRGTRIDSGGDHRIAMAFAVAGLIADSPTRILQSECAGISFPDFFEVLRECCH